MEVFPQWMKFTEANEIWVYSSGDEHLNSFIGYPIGKLKCHYPTPTSTSTEKANVEK